MTVALSGKRLGRYEVKYEIGAGGMGQVYLARDTQLERQVALKILPPGLAADEAKMRRFVQEAKAASALNHPNIITIHEIGVERSTYFIAAEYVRGETLREILDARPLDIAEVLDVAAQIASALVVAHHAGIIHRDVKPENVMVRPDGYVKVLDFGLAKLIEPPPLANPTSATLVGENTDPDVIMGTPNYMSPEQVRGAALDARTDVWSLGALLYEMLTGRRAFDGQSTGDIIVAILERKLPPVSRYALDAPPELEKIVTKCLRRRREDRYQSVKEVFADLRQLKRQLQFQSSITAATPEEPSRGARTSITEPTNTTGEYALDRVRRTASFASPPPLLAATSSGLTGRLFGLKPYQRNAILIGAALLIFLAGVGVGVYQYVDDRPDSSSSSASSLAAAAGGDGARRVRAAKLTASGKITRAAISPDGKYVVYAMSEAGRQSLWVRQVATPSNVRIVEALDVTYRGLTFARNGDFIYYVVQEGNNPTQMLYQVPALGGSVRKILSGVDSPVAVSPDGARLAFVRRDRASGEDSIVVADAAGGDGAAARVLATRGGDKFYGIGGPAWSPDGKFVACAAGSRNDGRFMSVVEIGVAGEGENLLTDQKWFDVGRVTYLNDGGGLVASATEQGSHHSQVWRIAERRATKITDDFNDYRDLSVNSDSSVLMTVQSEARVNIWTAAGGANYANAKRLTDGVGEYDGVRGVAWMPAESADGGGGGGAAGGRVVYVSRASGSQDIWVMNADGTEKKQLTTAATRSDVYPAVSGDGRHIVFTSNRGGNSNIWRMTANGAQPTRLTDGIDEEFPDVSPDGKTVVYTSTATSKFTVWKVSADGGPSVQLTDKLSQWPVISPDGELFACWYRADAQAPWRIAVLPLEGDGAARAPLYVFDVPATVDFSVPVRWSADGKAITYIDTRDGVSNLWGRALANFGPASAARQITDFKSEQIFWFDWSPDGKLLICARGSVTNDVILISSN